MGQGGYQLLLGITHYCADERNESKKKLLHNNKNWAELLEGFSVQQASPNALHEEKHEQFTPMGDVNFRRLFSRVLKLAISLDEKQGLSPG